jgi:flagellar protein FlgJ
MTRIDAAAPAGRPTVPDRLASLKDSAGKLEGIFVEQLFKAMQETVPQDGLTSGGQGEDIFRGMLDQKIADDVPSQWHRGIASALVRELSVHVRSETK